MISTQARRLVLTYRRNALHHGTRSSSPAIAGAANELQITDPLAIYRAKVARGELDEDQEQVKALVKLRNLSRRLQDYTPPAHLLGILNTGQSPLSFQGEDTRDAGSTASQQQQQQQQLVRYLSTSQTLADLDTPRGLLITGPPGTGKSMVLDIWFDSLPTTGKFRRHYHHLLLTIYRIIWLEAEKRRQALRGGAPPQPLATSEKDLEWGQHVSSGPRRTVLPSRGTGVVWKRGGEHGVRPDGKGSGWRRVLQGMPFFRPDSLSDSDGAQGHLDAEAAYAEATANVATASNTTLPLHAAAQLFLKYGPVMLFDEVQLVDIASAGLLKRTLEAYWLLGGVVVGSSNRLPEDLYNNGVQQQQLVQFFEALKTRCPVHEMKSERDFRRSPGAVEFWTNLGLDEASANAKAAATADQEQPTSSLSRTSYYVHGQEAAFEQRLASLIASRTPTPTTLKVYNRPLQIPIAYPPSTTTTPSHPSLALFTFPQLCDAPLGPADYLTIVSHFEEIVVRDVPQLLLVNKNLARRWITFIDAAYEAGTRLTVLAASGPDELFFPEARGERRENRRRGTAGTGVGGKPKRQRQAEPDDVVDMSARGARSPFLTPREGEVYPEEEEEREEEHYDLDSADLIQSETLSEARQDVEEGFRPNISSYVDGDVTTTSTSATPDSASSPSSSTTRTTAAAEAREARRLLLERQREREEIVVGFPDLAIFSGADERFSYARAVSRLHEMGNDEVWRRRKRWSPLLESELMLWGVAGRGGDDQGVGKGKAEAEEAPFTSGGTGTGATPSPTGHASREAHPTLASMTDFADEASYEASTFPGRTSSYADPDLLAGGSGSSSPSSSRMKGGPVAHNMPGSYSYGQRDLDGDNARPVAPTRRPPADDDDAVQHERANGDSSGGPPRISPVHVWGLETGWGPRAGRWGQGPSALAAADAEGKDDKEAAEQAARLGREQRAKARARREAERLLMRREGVEGKGRGE